MTSSTDNSQTSLVLTSQTSPPHISASTPVLPITTMGAAPISSIYSHPVFAVSNIKNFVSEVLHHHNYILWKELMIPFIRSKGVFGHLDGSDPCPPITDPSFEQWMQIDYQILTWIQATISSEILQFIIQPGRSLTAKQAWDAIELAYHDQLEANAILYRQEYAALKKEPNQSMLEYLQRAKKIADQLYSIKDPVSDRDLVLRILAGLDQAYSVSKRTIPQRVPFPSFLQLRSLLLIEEANLQHETHQAHVADSFSSPQVLISSTVSQQQKEFSGASRPAFKSNNHRGGRNKFRGHGGLFQGNRSPGQACFSGFRGSEGSNFSRPQNPFSPRAPWSAAPQPSLIPVASQPPLLPTSSSVIICQWCGKMNHQARDCPLLSRSSQSSHQSFTPQAYMVDSAPSSFFFDNASTTSTDHGWTFDSGSMVHVSKNTGNLSSFTPYSGLVSRPLAASPPARGQAPGLSQHIPQEKVWSEERLWDMSMAAIKEFYSARDEKEVALCIRDLNSPSFHPSMIALWLSDSFERKDLERDLLAKLLVNLTKPRDGMLSQGQLIKGFESVLGTLEDAVIDAPKAAEYLGLILAEVIMGDVLSLWEIGQLLSDGGEDAGRLLEVGLAGDVLGSTLATIKKMKGETVLNEILNSSNLHLEDFRPPDPYRSRILEMLIRDAVMD